LTRASILQKRKKMDCRIKLGNDDTGFLASEAKQSRARLDCFVAYTPRNDEISLLKRQS